MRALLPIVIVLSGGCALTSKSAPRDIRYFALDTVPATTLPAVRPAPALGLGHVTSSAFLRNPIVFRRSSHEVGIYDDRRWTEYPETYLRRSLASALFESEGGFVEGLGPRVPMLDVELVAFEAALDGRAPAGRVQIGYRLHDDRTVLAMGIITATRAASGDGAISSVVDAIGAALSEATARLAFSLRAPLGVNNRAPE